VADFPTSLSVDVNGRTYVAGYTAGVFSGLAGVGGVDGFVHRLDNAGADISTWQFGTTAGDFCYAVQVDPAGNVYVAGETSGAFPGETALGLGDAFLRKYEKSGAVAWTRLFATTYGDTSYALALDNAGSAYITGLISGTANGQGGAGYDDTYVRKYDGQGAVVWSRQLGTDRVDYGFGLVVGKGGNAFLVGDTDGALMGKTNNGSRDVIVLKLAP
jgi:hypothetical protein